MAERPPVSEVNNVPRRRHKCRRRHHGLLGLLLLVVSTAVAAHTVDHNGEARWRGEPRIALQSSFPERSHKDGASVEKPLKNSGTPPRRRRHRMLNTKPCKTKAPSMHSKTKAPHAKSGKNCDGVGDAGDENFPSGTQPPLPTPVLVPTPDVADSGGYGGSPSPPDSYIDTDGDGIADSEDTSLYSADPQNNDSDGDGVGDGDEFEVGTDLLEVDTDGVGLGDGYGIEVDTDPLQFDTDEDGLGGGDEIEFDRNPLESDTDGVGDGDEVEAGSDPLKPDSDGDGLTDLQEEHLGTDPSDSDSDGDTHSDQTEIKEGSGPLDPFSIPDEEVDVIDSIEDADSDGLSDVVEVDLGTDPEDEDTDGDSLSDGEEINIYGTNPLVNDTDLDGLTDHEEVTEQGTHPQKADTDGDGLPDGVEVLIATDPLARDTDEDGISDKDEIVNNLDPLVPNTSGGPAKTNSPGCGDFANGKVYETKISAKVRYTFEVVVESPRSISSRFITDDLENKTAKLVGEELILCSEDSRRLGVMSSRSTAPYFYPSLPSITTTVRQPHHGRSLSVDGINAGPRDILSGKPCTYFIGDNTVVGADCFVVNGLMTLYLRENNAQTSKSESSNQALRAILTAYNNESPSRFIASQGGEYAVKGVRALRYISGTPDDGPRIDNTGTGENLPSTNVGGLAAEDEIPIVSEEDDNLTPLGITLVAIGGIALVILALVTVRKRKRVKESSYEEFYDDELNDLDFKADVETIATKSSFGSPDRNMSAPTIKSKAAYIFGEEDSVYTSTFRGADNIMDDLRRGEQIAMENDADPTHDVHQCHSATCAICTHHRRDAEPLFIHAYDDNDEFTTEQGVETPPHSSIFEWDRGYTRPVNQLSMPTFDNPSLIGKNKAEKRVYIIEDTVEL